MSVSSRRDLGRIIMPGWVGRLFRPVNFRLYDGYFNVRNRLFMRWYLLDVTEIKRHEYCDATEFIFHAAFQILVNYVEDEVAHLGKFYGDQPEQIAWRKASWIDKIIHKKRWNERLGMAALEADAQLNDSMHPDFTEVCQSQANNAQKALALYKWYKFERPARVEPDDAFERPTSCYVTDAGELTNKMLSLPDNTGMCTANDFTPEYRDYIFKVSRLEDEYFEEDTRKAQEVVALRSYLWT